MALPLLGQECPSKGFFRLCSSQLSPCSHTSLRSEVPGHARDLYVLGFLGHPVKWECQGFLASLFDTWCWISKLPTLAFKDIASSVLLSGINWFPPPSHFLERVLWSSSLDPCLLFKFLGTVKKCVSNKCTGSRVKGRAGWDMNQQAWAQPSMCLDVDFFPSKDLPLWLLCLSGSS